MGRRAPRTAAGGRPRVGAIQSSFCARPTKAESRAPIPIRFGRMAESPFAFYRGAAAIMAADLASTPTSGLRVQACGDAHLMNFGGFATPERNIFFDINDFDETLPAPWEWDVKRLAASIVIAARHLDLLDSEAAKAATESVCSYRERMADYASMRALDVWYDRIDLDRVLKVLPSGAEVERVGQRVEQARRKSLPESLFPSSSSITARRRGSRIRRRSSSIRRTSKPRASRRDTSRRSKAIGSHCPSISACCSTGFGCLTLRSRSSA